jgi:cytochrome c-type biogenesis protein CcmH/NrfG
MGWVLLILMALGLFLALWRFAGFDRVTLQLLGSALLIAMAGYALQGRPGLAGKPVPPPSRQKLSDSAFAGARREMLGQFDTASRWLIIADSYHRSGNTQSAVGILRAGIKAHPRDPDLWVGLGNALIIHGGGMMSPAAELAFQRAAKFGPNQPGPRFFYGLALAQGGRFEQAEQIWRGLLESAPADAEWRPMVQSRLARLLEIRRAAPPEIQ